MAQRGVPSGCYCETVYILEFNVANEVLFQVT